MAPTEAVLTSWYEAHRAFLWGLCYRITGSAADADDVVQDVFVRACRHAPTQLDDPRRWLIRVAVNAARDVLRRRKRRGYIGPWLPTPIETDIEDSLPSFEPTTNGQTLEGRYDLLESASLAFLQALEGLGPTQRAVLILRDVFDYSAAEVAAVLDVSEGNVRVIHHRARQVMKTYERRRVMPSARSRSRTAEALQRFLQLLSAADVHGIEEMLAADVKAVTDGGGQFSAALAPITGVSRVAKFFARLAASRQAARLDITIRNVNQFPAALLHFASAKARRPPNLLLSLDVDRTGHITDIRVIANSAKLAAVVQSPSGDGQAAGRGRFDARPPSSSIARARVK